MTLFVWHLVVFAGFVVAAWVAVTAVGVARGLARHVVPTGRRRRPRSVSVPRRIFPAAEGLTSTVVEQAPRRGGVAPPTRDRLADVFG